MTNQERSLAAVSHGVSAASMVLSLTYLGWLVPLIIFYTKRRESKFVAFHALQSVYLHFGLFVASIALTIVGSVFLKLSWVVMILLGIGALLFEIEAAIRANQGKWYAIPFAGQLTRQTLGDP